jgi:hypothetical protein
VSTLRHPEGVDRGRTHLRWSLVASTEHLDPDRFLGEVTGLPSNARPGDWCRVVLVDELGDLCWTLVALEVERASSMFAERRPTAPLGDPLDRLAPHQAFERVAERQGADGSVTHARETEGGADRSAAVPVRRRR